MACFATLILFCDRRPPTLANAAIRPSQCQHTSSLLCEPALNALESTLLKNPPLIPDAMPERLLITALKRYAVTVVFTYPMHISKGPLCDGPTVTT